MQSYVRFETCRVYAHVDAVKKFIEKENKLLRKAGTLSIK